jgi:hypothetical protein
MAGLNDDAQWIVLMGFVVSFSLFFLAMLLNQSTLVGQTTAEGVLDFPKNDIRDVKEVIIDSSSYYDPTNNDHFTVIQDDIKALALSRKEAVVTYTIISTPSLTDPHTHISIHYNNGVTEYNEYWTSL